MTALGFIFLLSGMTLIAFCFYLYVVRALPASVAISLLLMNWLLGTWWLPVLTPMRLRREK
jgi:hypothetical protein